MLTYKSEYYIVYLFTCIIMTDLLHSRATNDTKCTYQLGKRREKKTNNEHDE